MATVTLDARGMKCPLPVLKLNNLVLKKEAKPGDTISVTADCPTFEADLRKWCEQQKKMLIVLKDLGTHKQAEIRV
jgi:tRNA 2-thiouridine synthesizing protein A